MPGAQPGTASGRTSSAMTSPLRTTSIPSTSPHPARARGRPLPLHALPARCALHTLLALALALPGCAGAAEEQPTTLVDQVQFGSPQSEGSHRLE